MSCIPATHSAVTVPDADPKMEEMPRRGSRVYQLFPESPALTDSEGRQCSEEMLYRRERLPSIVLEPTEQGEEEGEGEGGRDSAQGGDGSGDRETGERQEEAAAEGPPNRKSSIGPVQSPKSSSRLTPPPSPTSPEAAPPCLRS